MSIDPRAALDRLIVALENHHDACTRSRGGNDAAVEKAYDLLADAFEAYDDALYEKFEESTPFAIDDEDEDEIVYDLADFDDEEDDFDEFDDDEFDFDTDDAETPSARQEATKA